MNHVQKHPAIFSVLDALDAGLTRRQVRGRAASYRLSCNVYATRGEEFTATERTIAIARTMPGCVLTSVTAAQLLGMRLPYRLLEEQTTYVLTHKYQERIRRQQVKASKSVAREDEILVTSECLITTPLRTLLELAQLLSVDELTCVIDGLLVFHEHRYGQRTPLFTREQISDYLSTRPGKRGVAQCKKALLQAVSGSDSWKESELRLLLEKYGVRGLRANEPVLDASGRILFEPDLGDFERQICVQYEGVHHGGHEQVRSDVRRQRRTAQAGWREVRVFSEDFYQMVEYGERVMPRAVAVVKAAIVERSI